MNHLADMRRSARLTQDDQGQPVVQVPLDIWEGVMGPLDEEVAPQHIRLNTLLDDWETQDQGTTDWWDAFDGLLRDNRLDLSNESLDR